MDTQILGKLNIGVSFRPIIFQEFHPDGLRLIFVTIRSLENKTYHQDTRGIADHIYMFIKLKHKNSTFKWNNNNFNILTRSIYLFLGYSLKHCTLAASWAHAPRIHLQSINHIHSLYCTINQSNIGYKILESYLRSLWYSWVEIILQEINTRARFIEL